MTRPRSQGLRIRLAGPRALAWLPSPPHPPAQIEWHLDWKGLGRPRSV